MTSRTVRKFLIVIHNEEMRFGTVSRPNGVQRTRTKYACGKRSSDRVEVHNGVRTSIGFRTIIEHKNV